MKKLSIERGRWLKKQYSLPQTVSFGSRAYKKNLHRWLVSRPQDRVSRKIKPAPTYKPQVISLLCPRIFSMVNNTEEVLKFFENSFFHFERKDHFCMDFSQVEEITIDVLMYFIALLRNLAYKKYKFNITMKPPAKPDIRTFIENSGFFDFAKSKRLTLQKDFCEIHVGNNYTPEDVYKLAKFACNDIGQSSDDLGSVLKELLSNVEEHAYGSATNVSNNWYIFCNKSAPGASIVLMDVGSTIPHTVKKKGLKEQINFISSDVKLIASALRGEARTSVAENDGAGRGNGLNTLISSGSTIKNLKVLSRRGFYSESQQINVPIAFNGSLFVFDIARL